MNKLDFLDYLELFFSNYVFLQRGLSPNTVSSYSDSFLLFFRFCQDKKGIRADKVSFQVLNRQLIIDFCNWLETSQMSSVSTRNQRLTAIHALFRYIQGESPEHMALCRDIRSIHMKKHRQEPPCYLSTEAVRTILAEPDLKTMEGIRELAALSLMYDSAIRVQELIDIKVGDIILSRPAVIRVTGKGNKIRIVPLTPATADILALYEKTYGRSNREQSLFVNRSGNPLTRVGINYILNKHVATVRAKHPELISISVTPHIMRHSKATHLLLAGVNLIYIRDLLGHSSVTTTERYATSNPEFLRQAIEKTAGNVSPVLSDEVDSKKKKLMEFLKQYRI